MIIISKDFLSKGVTHFFVKLHVTRSSYFIIEYYFSKFGIRAIYGYDTDEGRLRLGNDFIYYREDGKVIVKETLDVWGN